MQPRADLRTLRAIVEGVARRWQTLLGTGVPQDVEVPDLDWSTGELTAHVISVVESFQRYLSTQVGPSYSYDRLAEYNQHRLDEVTERHPGETAPRMERAVSGFLQMTRNSEPNDPFPWFDGHLLDVATAYALLAAELLVHGRDLARGRGVSWPIPAAEARHTVMGLLPAVPASVDRQEATGTELHARVRLWGAPTFGLRARSGGLEVTNGSGPVDVTLWAHPTAFLLATFGRVRPLSLVLSGRALAWGRRPWIALSLPRLLRT